jgi:hypothetical protein
MNLVRRKFLHFLTAAAAIPARPDFAWAEVSTPASQNVRVAIGLLAMSAVIHRDTCRAARTVDRVLRAVEGILGRDDGATGDRSEIDRAIAS